MERLGRELRFAFRRLRRSPRFTLCAIAILSVTVGANLVIFAAVDALLVRPLPFFHAEELVEVDQAGFQRDIDGTLDIQDWVAECGAFDAVALSNTGTLNLAGDPDPRPVRATQVSSAFFSVLGVEPLFGSVPRARGSESWRASVVVISSRFWRDRFGSDPHTLGRILRLNGHPYSVAAVMPPEFDFPERTELWVPASFTRGLFYGGLVFSFIGRMHEGSSIAESQARIDAVATHYFRENPNAYQRKVTLRPLQRKLVKDVHTPLLILQVGAAFLMLIGFVNTANVLMARATAHRHELAVRAALGASWSSLVRQSLNEVLLLSVFGWLGGVMIAHLALGLLRARIPSTLPNYDQIGLSPRVFGIALAAVLTLALLFGILSGLNTLRSIGSETLGKSPGGLAGRTGARLSLSFAVSQVVLAVVLLSSSGLLFTSFRRLLGVQLGFDPERAVAFDVLLAGGKNTEKLQVDFLDGALERIRRLPGVVSAGASMRVPLRYLLATAETGVPVLIEGRPPSREGAEPRARIRSTTSGYFGAMRIARLAGRDFVADDRSESPPVVIVDEGFAKLAWKGQDAIGKRLKPGWDVSGPWREVVGVVGSVRGAGPDAGQSPTVYFPYQQQPWRVMTLIVRAAGEPETVVEEVRQEIRAIDPALPLYNVSTMSEAYERWFSERRALMMASGFFAACALVLAAMGVYGLFSYLVTLRTREFGIRLAVGAPRGNLLRRVLGEAAKWLLLGVVLGLAVSAGLSSFLKRYLFGVSPVDATILASACLVIVLAGLAAALVPALRAAAVDPVVTLRHE